MKFIAFTPWNSVIIKGFCDRREISRLRFFIEMYWNIHRNKGYGVYFDDKTSTYTAMLKGDRISVSLSPEVEAHIKKGQASKETKDIDELVKITRRIEKKKNSIKENEDKIERIAQKIKKIELSGYSELKTTEDYEIYLEYLNNKFKEAKTDEEKTLINAKIRGLLKAITNPYDLKLHLYGLICDVANEGKKLDDDKQAQLEEILRDIANDYYQKIVSKSGDTLTLGSAIKPLDIIRRIESAEHLVRTWKEKEQEQVLSKVEVIEPEPIQEEDMAEDNLDEISNMLDTIKRGNR